MIKPACNIYNELQTLTSMIPVVGRGRQRYHVQTPKHHKQVPNHYERAKQMRCRLAVLPTTGSRRAEQKWPLLLSALSINDMHRPDPPCGIDLWLLNVAVPSLTSFLEILDVRRDLVPPFSRATGENLCFSFSLQVHL
jgi:hypothetical protein